MKKSKIEENSISFEKALLELQKKVQLLESGDLSLEDALKNYEEGIGLARKCQSDLKKAEQKISTLKPPIE